MFDKTKFFHHKYALGCGIIGLFLYTVSIISGYDFFEYLVDLLNYFENLEMDELCLIFIFILVGLLLDFVANREIEAQKLKRKEIEKKHLQAMNEEMQKHIDFLHDLSNDFSQPLMALFGLFEVFELKLGDVESVPKDKLEKRMESLREILRRIKDIMKTLREETKRFSG